MESTAAGESVRKMAQQTLLLPVAGLAPGSLQEEDNVNTISLSYCNEETKNTILKYKL